MTEDFEENTVIAARPALNAPPRDKATKAYVIVIAGPRVGEMFKLGEAGFIGRGDEADIRILDTEISRKHARFYREGENIWLEDQGSTNGTLVNGEPLKLRLLQDGDKIQVGTTTILKFSYHDDLDEQFQRQMYESALRDGLTMAYNKKYLSERLASEVAYALRHGSHLSLLMLDLDHFKRVNDEFGHLAGDYVLSTLSRGVHRSIRKEDVFARYGGEEFCLLSRGIDRRGAYAFAERMRAAVAGFKFSFEKRAIPVTISIGVASLPHAEIDSPDALVAGADKALYAAKEAGRNRVVVFD